MQKRNNPMSAGQSEELKLQKRENPLTLDQAAPAAETPVKEKTPSAIVGKAKKKRIFVAVDRAVYQELVAASGKKPADVVTAALIGYAYSEYPEAFSKAKRQLQAKGCDIE